MPAIPATGITVTVSTGRSAPASTIIPSPKTQFPTGVVAVPAQSPTSTEGHAEHTTPSPEPTDNGENSEHDDENLPFCDEL